MPHPLSGVRWAPALLLLAALTACSDESGGPTDPTHPPSAEKWSAVDQDFADIRALMGQRARAVLINDRELFLSTVDGSDPDLREQQEVLFTNLLELPVTAISYGVSNNGVGPADITGDDPVLAPLIHEHVRLDRVFKRAVSNIVTATFVRRDGQWLLGAETVPDEASTFGAPQSRPWFGGAIEVAESDDMVVVTDDEGGIVARDLLQEVQRDLAAVASFLGIEAQPPVLIDATSHGSVPRMNTLDPDEAAGVLVPVWATDKLGDEGRGLAGHVIKLHPDLVERLADNDVLMRHELVHLLLDRYSAVVPLWLSEGLAEYVGHGGAPISLLDISAGAYQQLSGETPELVESGNWGLAPASDYLIGRAAVQELVTTGGIARIKTLLQDYRIDYWGPYVDGRTAKLIKKNYGFTEDELARRAFAVIRRAWQ